MSMAERFKITNTTVKPPRLVHGVDQRSIKEKTGHFIEFKDDRGQSRLLGPGHFAIIGYLDQWFIEQERKKEIEIEQIKDMGSALEQFRHHAELQANQETPKSASRKAKSTEMGKVKNELGDGKNPDGDPNFVVKAPRTGANKDMNVASS